MSAIPADVRETIAQVQQQAEAVGELLAEVLRDGAVPWLNETEPLAQVRMCMADMADCLHRAELDSRKAWRRLNRLTRGKRQ